MKRLIAPKPRAKVAAGRNAKVVLKDPPSDASRQFVSPRGGTRAAIVAAAERRFAQLGYESTTLEMIADDVGIRRPSLLHHFPSKSACYEAVLERLLDHQRRVLQVAFRATYPNCYEKLRSMLSAWIDWLVENPDYISLMYYNTATSYQFAPHLMQKIKPLIGWGRKVLKAGVDSGEFLDRPIEDVISLAPGYAAHFIRFSSVSGHPPDRRVVAVQLQANISVLLSSLLLKPTRSKAARRSV